MSISKTTILWIMPIAVAALNAPASAAERLSDRQLAQTAAGAIGNGNGNGNGNIGNNNGNGNPGNNNGNGNAGSNNGNGNPTSNNGNGGGNNPAAPRLLPDAAIGAPRSGWWFHFHHPGGMYHPGVAPMHFNPGGGSLANGLCGFVSR